MVPILFIWLLLSPPSQAQVTQDSCRQLSTKIQYLESRLRQGYKIKQGEAIKKKLRKLKKQRYQCRKRRLAVK